jgi:enoyl-CoA hydratase/carnithine racemase
VYKSEYITRNWERIRSVRKPVIAAVAGFALGGGCEIALACDIVIAADTAKFGQPEIKLGIIPGAGGTQRLPRLIGVERALGMILSGEPITAQQAQEWGQSMKSPPAIRAMQPWPRRSAWRFPARRCAAAASCRSRRSTPACAAAEAAAAKKRGLIAPRYCIAAVRAASRLGIGEGLQRTRHEPGAAPPQAAAARGTPSWVSAKWRTCPTCRATRRCAR